LGAFLFFLFTQHNQPTKPNTKMDEEEEQMTGGLPTSSSKRIRTPSVKSKEALETPWIGGDEEEEEEHHQMTASSSKRIRTPSVKSKEALDTLETLNSPVLFL
jgi:hypothetical protein